MNDDFLKRVNSRRLSDRQIDELVGLSRGLIADDHINQQEVAFLQKWLAVNADISGHPLINSLYSRVNKILADGVADEDECRDLLLTLQQFTTTDFELGELLKPTTLPLCSPAPVISFPQHRYSFTGTCSYGGRKDCEAAVTARGGAAGSLTQKTNVLVIGEYVTDSWKHSSFGNKIVQAVEWRQAGLPIKIVSEAHWRAHL